MMMKLRGQPGLSDDNGKKQTLYCRKTQSYFSLKTSVSDRKGDLRRRGEESTARARRLDTLFAMFLWYVIMHITLISNHVFHLSRLEGIDSENRVASVTLGSQLIKSQAIEPCFRDPCNLRPQLYCLKLLMYNNSCRAGICPRSLGRNSESEHSSPTRVKVSYADYKGYQVHLNRN